MGVRRWRELVAGRKKNGRTLFDRPKPTVGCANGRRRNIYIYITPRNRVINKPSIGVNFEESNVDPTDVITSIFT